MKTTIFKNIHSLDDIHKQKLLLKKKIKLSEKSISEKSTAFKLLFINKEKTSSILDENNNLELIKYFLPLGIEYILKLFHKRPGGKLNKRILTYTILGSLSAMLVYQYLRKRGEPESSANK